MSLLLTSSDTDLRKAFAQLQTRQDVAQRPDVTDAKLTYHIFRSKPAERYREFAIPKRRGGVRIIKGPRTALKILQQKLNQVLLAVYEPRRPVQGFVRSRSIVSNAAP